MAKFTKIQNNFLVGEISPKFYGRTDIAEYDQGVKTLKNFNVFPQGGASKRPGTIMVAETDDGNAWDSEIRLLPFVFSKEESYVVIINTGSNSKNSFGVQVYDIVNETFLSVSDGASSLMVGFENFSDGDALQRMQHTQTGDIMILATEESYPKLIYRTAAQTFSVADIVKLNDIVKPTRITHTETNEIVESKYSTDPIVGDRFYSQPFEDYNAVNKQGLGGTPASTSGSSFSISGLAGDAADLAPGEYLGLNIGGVTGFAQRTNPSVNVFGTTNGKAFGGTTASDSILIPQWRNKSSFGFPIVCSLFEQRLLFAANNRYPNKIWGSQTGDISEILSTRPVDDSNSGDLSNDRPFEFILASNEINEIQWLVPFGRSLMCGTLGAEYLINAGTSAESLGPLAVQISKETAVGSEPWIPIVFDGSLIYIQRGGLKLREFVYNRDENAFRSNDLSFFSEHLPRLSDSIFASSAGTGIQQLYVQRTPYQLIWAIDKNGYLFSLTRERTFGANAWGRHELGGESDTNEPPKVISACVVPNTDGQEDLYMMVQRKVNGVNKVTFERLSRPFEKDDVAITGTDISKYPVYVDAAQLLSKESDVTFMVRYDTTKNASVFIDNQKATSVGSSSILNGKLDLTGATLKYVEYEADGNADSQQLGSIRIRVTPDYAGSPAADQTFVAISKAKDDADNLIEIFHTSAGNLGYQINDSSGSSIASGSAAWSPTSGTEYELLFTYDLTTGDNDLYVDGSSHASDSGTGSRDAAIDYLVIGTDEAQNNNADFSVSYFAIYSAKTSGIAVNSRIYDRFVQTQGSIYFGQTIQAVLAGKYMGESVNQFGHSILAEDPADGNVLLGFKYESDLETLDIEAGSILGSAQGQTRRIDELVLRFESTIGGKYGFSTSDLLEIDFREFQYGDNEAIELLTGDKTVKFPGSFAENYYVFFRHDLPFPCYLTAMIMRGNTYD